MALPPVLISDESPRGGLRERIRERRESRSMEKEPQRDPVASQESNTRPSSRRITRERVQLWIEQLRDRIRDGIGNSGENDSLQTQVGPRSPGGLPFPSLPGFSASPLPAPTVPQDKTATSTPPEFGKTDGKQDMGAPGPELVVPQVLPPVTGNTEIQASDPMKAFQASESGKTSEAAHRSTQAPDSLGSAGQDAAGTSGNSQGQPSSKPSALTGIFSNVGKILGAGNSNGQQAIKKGAEQETSATGPTISEAKPSSETPDSSKPLTTTRKTLAEIRKQIILRQSQEASKPAN